MVAAVFLSAALAGAAGPAPVRKPPAAEPAPALPQFTPGEETRVDDPSLGGQGYYVVYVPKEYTPDRTWPAIFCYHGVDQKPTTYPFRGVVGGKGFIIVGMCYNGGPGLGAYDKVSHDVDNVKRLLPVLSAQLKFDVRQLFIGGFSMGGFMSSSIGECTASIWAGMAICGAGRGSGGGVKEPQGFRGKPIYVGVGEKCTYNKSGKDAADHYRGAGAQVTFEEYPGKGHTVDTRSKVFSDWLWSSGPLKQAKADLAEAKALQAAGKLGQAYAKFAQVAAIPGGQDVSAEAGKAAEAIAKEADTQLASAEAAVKDKRYAEAPILFTRLMAAYEGSAFGERARQGLDAMKADPTIQAAVEKARINAEAKAVEDKALAAEAAKDYAQAIKCYEKYVAEFPTADRCAEVRNRLDALKADKTIRSAIVSQKAERDCRGWLQMADNFAKAGVKDRAREYLQKVLDTYPDTEWAKEAKEGLKKLK